MNWSEILDLLSEKDFDIENSKNLISKMELVLVLEKDIIDL